MADEEAKLRIESVFTFTKSKSELRIYPGYELEDLQDKPETADAVRMYTGHLMAGHMMAGHLMAGHMMAGHLTTGHLATGHLRTGHLTALGPFPRAVIRKTGDITKRRLLVYRDDEDTLSLDIADE